MKHLDLGQRDEDLLVFGGPYSNLQAMQALLGRAAELEIDGRSMICTGDIVAYCAEPSGTVAAVRDSGVTVVAGNCEKQLAAGSGDCGCGFEEGSTCDRLSAQWFAYARNDLRPQDRAWMGDLPDIVTFTHHEVRYAVVHGGATDVARFIWACDADTVFDAEWEAVRAVAGEVQAIIAGHSGLPFLRVTQHGSWINTGVIGMPAHDGDPMTRFGILSGGAMRIERLEYDVDAAMDEMRKAGLPPEYREALKTGYWPSEDVLPDALRVLPSARG